jgi:hypothetical protein
MPARLYTNNPSNIGAARFYTYVNTTVTFNITGSSNPSDICFPFIPNYPILVRTSNNDGSLDQASGNSSTLFQMPGNTLLTGYLFVQGQFTGEVYNINPSTAVVGGPSCN